LRIGALIGLVAVAYWRAASSVAAGRGVETGAGELYAPPDERHKLIVDGRRSHGPQRVTGLTPGEHTIVFNGGPIATPFERTVTLFSERRQQIEAASLKVTKGRPPSTVKDAVRRSCSWRPTNDAHPRYSQRSTSTTTRAGVFRCRSPASKRDHAVTFRKQRRDLVVVLTAERCSGGAPVAAIAPFRGAVVEKKHRRSAKRSLLAANRMSEL